MSDNFRPYQLALYVISFPMSEAATLMLLPIIAPAVGVIIGNIVSMYDKMEPDVKACFITGFLTGISIIALPLGVSTAAVYPFISQLLTYLGVAGLASSIAVDLPSPNACLFK